MQYNNNNSGAYVAGISFTSTLGLIFIVLKLVGVIDWSWWLVLLPIYGPTLFIVIIIAILMVVGLIINAFEKRKDR